MKDVQTEMISQPKSINLKKVIDIKNLRKSFGNQEVLKSVSIKLFNGEN